MSENNLKNFQPLVYAMIMIMGIILGYRLYASIYDSSASTQLFNGNKNDLSAITDVINFIESNYVDSINSNSFVDDAINNLLSSLDPHSTYISPKQMQDVHESMQGNFEGIGIEFFIVSDTIFVVTPISGGPSESVGILAGDKIIKIENENVAGIGLTNADVINKLRGKKATLVNIMIKRENFDKLLPFMIKRDKIPIFSVDAGYMMDKETGYIKINRFAATTYTEFADKLVDLQNKGMQNLILDLRQNPGGYLTPCINIIDEFLPSKQLIVYTEGKNYKKREYKSKRNGLFEKGEVMVLIDQGSASASEIMAGALQDCDRATIVGRRSYGKGLVQEQYDLKNGGAIRLTVARYYTPTGRSIQKKYELGNDQDYNDDLENRLNNGELNDQSKIKVDESLKYTTAKGRTVYGGGGVVPDVFVAMDTSANSEFLIHAFSNLSEFSYQYFNKNRSLLSNFNILRNFENNFKVDRNLINEFRKFLSNESIKVDSRAFYKNESLFANRIKANIAKQLFNNDAFYKILNSDDIEIEKAISLLNKDLLVNKKVEVIMN